MSEKSELFKLHNSSTNIVRRRIERLGRCAGVPLPPVALSIEEEAG